MDDQHLLDELIRAVERLGVEVRMEPFETSATMAGGLCVLRGEKLVLIDRSAPLRERILALARALSELESETVYMAPEAREIVEAIQGKRFADGMNGPIIERSSLEKREIQGAPPDEGGQKTGPPRRSRSRFSTL